MDLQYWLLYEEVILRKEGRNQFKQRNLCPEVKTALKRWFHLNRIYLSHSNLASNFGPPYCADIALLSLPYIQEGEGGGGVDLTLNTKISVVTMAVAMKPANDYICDTRNDNEVVPVVINPSIPATFIASSHQATSVTIAKCGHGRPRKEPHASVQEVLLKLVQQHCGFIIPTDLMPRY
ncbi:hypothetical protein ARMGADRAFT_1040154 [Armillaria gallica]|uniref:Uncharacterized protein n=1 Tax=Armillaria gallica TaxID=47427 RepID=A0A2H3CPJ6_ARMGA|nr:hypothetical protein ARMGADRAFT_1040154 [Armillaria gallica]